MRATVALLAALLPGCASLGGAFAVKVPVPVECRESMPARPAMPTEALRPGGGLFVSMVALQAEIELREGYETKLRAALGACIAPLKASGK